MNRASAAIPSGAATSATRDRPGMPGSPARVLIVRIGLVAAHPFPRRAGDRVAGRARGADRRTPCRAGRRRTGFAAAAGSAAPRRAWRWTSPASSSSGRSPALRPPMRTRRPPRDHGRPRRGPRRPPARSAALPARPWPSTVRPRPSRSAPGVGRLPEPARRPRLVAHGGGAAQSRGGLRLDRAASAGRRRPARVGVLVDSCRRWSSTAWRSSGRPRPRRGRGRLGRSPAPRACAASRRAQSWNVGQTGNALDRQYASWCASGARRGWRLGEAAMAVVGARRTAFAVVTERDERTGRGTVHAGQPSLSHPAR